MNAGFLSVVFVSQKRSVVLDCLLLAVGLFILSACQANGILIKPQATLVAPTLTPEKPISSSLSAETLSGFCPDTLTLATGFAPAQADETLVVVSNFADPQGNDLRDLTPALVGRMRERLSTYPNLRVEQLDCAINPQAGNETALRIGDREDVQATILIWGVYATPAGSTVRINFNVVKEKKSDFGSHFFTPRNFRLNAFQPRSFDLEVHLGEQMKEVAAFSSGVALLNIGEYLAAEAFFTAEINATDTQQSNDFARIIHLYRGVNDLYLERETDAESELQQLQLAQTVDSETLDPIDLSILNALGLAHLTLHNRPKALEFYEQALPLYQAVGDKAGEARTLSDIGDVHLDLYDKEKALAYYEQALALYQAANDKAGEAHTLTRVGGTYFGLDDMQKAFEYEIKVALLSQSMDGKTDPLFIGVPDSLNLNENKNKKALEYYEQALALYQSIDDIASESRIFFTFGLIYSDLGEKQKAIEYYDQALSLCQVGGDTEGEDLVLTLIGVTYSNLGEIQKASDYYDRLDALQPELSGNKEDKLQKVLKYYEQVLPLYQAEGNKASEARVLDNMGDIYFGSGDMQKALEYYDQALPLWQAVGDKASEAKILYKAGFTYAKQGFLDPTALESSLEYYNRALPLYQAVGDKAGEAHTLSRIGGAYYGLDDKQKALEYEMQVLLLYQSMGDKDGEADTLSDIGDTYFSLDDMQKALESHIQALSLYQSIGDRDYQVYTLSDISEIYSALGNSQKAIESMIDRANLYHSLGNVSDEIMVYNQIAELQVALNDLDAAAESLETAIDLATEIDHFMLPDLHKSLDEINAKRNK